MSITGLALGYDDTRVTIGDTEIPKRAIAGLTVRADSGQIPELTLDLRTFDITQVGGQMKILIPDETRTTLVALGWTPPADGPE